MKTSRLSFNDLIFNPFTYLITGILLALVMPFILTRPALINWLDFTQTGAIGDTIGGITAPIINITAAILVFYSFREQFKANEQQIKVLNFTRKYDFIFGLISDLDRRINSFEYRLTYNKGTNSETLIYNGYDGLQRYSNHIFKEGNAFKINKFLNDKTNDEHLSMSYYSEIYHIISLLTFISEKVNLADVSKETKVDLFERLDMSYRISLQSSISTFLEAFDKLDNRHYTIEKMNRLFLKYIRNKANILGEETLDKLEKNRQILS